MSDRIEAEILDVLGEEVDADVDTPLVVIEGPKGDPGADGITPTIGDNGNWYLGSTDTGKPSRGATGPQGAPGIYYGTTPPTGDTHPVWIDPDGGPDDGGLLPAVTAADNGKVLRVVNSAWSAQEIPSAMPNPNALTFTGAVEGSYDGSAPLSVEIPSGGGSGSDISLGLTGAAAGQIAKITAVDDTGKPTAWAPVDMPDKLPNPKALTFTGAAAGTYDGSAPLSVKIPSSVTDDHINSLIDTKLGVIENGAY